MTSDAMRTASGARAVQRREADLEELAERIAGIMPGDGRVEPQEGVAIYRHGRPTEPIYSVSEPALCVIAQGSKEVLLGAERFRYDPAHFLITTMELPLVARIAEASPRRPFLGFRLLLDPALITSVIVESGCVLQGGKAAVKALDVSPLDAPLLDATLRLVRLLETPAEYRVLAPMVIREITYRLLVGSQAARLGQLATVGGQSHRMVRAVEKLRSHFDQPLRIEALARELGMSVSGFHAHFKAMTAMSPLQFQKQLRLQEARRLMLGEQLDAAQAGYRVGYDDASHFSRDYKRHFGQSPMRDVSRLQG